MSHVLNLEFFEAAEAVKNDFNQVNFGLAAASGNISTFVYAKDSNQIRQS